MPRKNLKTKLGKVYLVGAGPGDPGLLTLRAAYLLSCADIVLYDALVNPEILQPAAHAQKILVGRSTKTSGDKRKTSENQAAINRMMVRYAKLGKHVVRLKGGDPFVFGRGGEEALYLKKNQIAFEIVPGVSAGFGVPAYAGIPVTDRRLASVVTFVTANEDPSKKEFSVDWKNLAKRQGTLVLFMAVGSLSKVAQALMDAGKSKSTPVSVIENGTLPSQRIVEGPLCEIAKLAVAKKIVSPAITVIGDVNLLRKELAWFDKRPLSGKTIVVTRPTAQSESLSNALNSLGAEVLHFPSIEIAAPRDWAPLDRAIRQIRQFDWIVFTSVNGVIYFIRRLLEKGEDVRVLSEIKIAAIGEKTKEVLSQFGLKADLMPEKFTSESLVEKLQKEDQVLWKSFLLPRTDIAPEYLSRKLRELGGTVCEVVAYRTISNPNPSYQKELLSHLTRDPADFVTFTSASTVDHFFGNIPSALRKKLRTKYVSIGPVTSKTIRSYGEKVFCEAKTHTIQGIVEAMSYDSK